MHVLWGNREDIQRTGAQIVKTAQSWENLGGVTGVNQGTTAAGKCTALMCGSHVCNQAMRLWVLIKTEKMVEWLFKEK